MSKHNQPLAVGGRRFTRGAHVRVLCATRERFVEGARRKGGGSVCVLCAALCSEYMYYIHTQTPNKLRPLVDVCVCVHIGWVSLSSSRFGVLDNNGLCG